MSSSESRTATFAALVIGVALLACKREDDQPTPVATIPPPAPTVSGPCPTGKSEDPNIGEFKPAVTAFKEKNYGTARLLLENMAKKYPNSATVRVWQGDAELFDKKLSYEKSADAALPFYESAEKLNDKGCKLPEYEHYYLRMGMAYAHLRKKDGKSAIPHLKIAKKNWPDSAEVYYNLARAHCREGDVEDCADEFENTLKTAKALKRPKFLRTHHSLEDWIRRSRRQSEFPKLRVTKQYRDIIKKYSED